MRVAIPLAALGVLCGCAAVPPQAADTETMTRAAAEIRANRAQCVVIASDGVFFAERGRGVSPLLKLYDEHPAAMKGGTVVDKVIGRAAAAIAICGGAVHVHGEVMSEDAMEFLTASGIGCSQTKMVPRILNRSRDGLCPLERSVEGIREPEKALAALRKKVGELQKTSGQPRK